MTVPNKLAIDDSHKRIIHESGLVAVVHDKSNDVTLEYYPGGVRESDLIGWSALLVNRPPSIEEVALFNAAVKQVNIASSLALTTR